MTEIICSAIAGMATIVCGVLTYQSTKKNKEIAEANARSEKRAAQRAQESKLSLALMDANCSLTVGVALALKHNHCNGEVEAGLEAVRKAQADYLAFMESIAIEHLAK